MASQTDPLVRAFKTLKSADPQAYDLAMQAFADYTHSVTGGLVNAEINNVLVQQGRSQQCWSLLELLTTGVTKYQL